MDRAGKQHYIRTRAATLNVKWSRHALSELAADKVSVADIENALCDSLLIEDYPQTRRYLPDCLVMMHDHDNNPIHAVIAVDEAQDYILIVTIYRPNPKEWESDWRTRK